MSRFSARHIGARETQTVLDFSRQRVLECVRMLAQTLAICRRRVPRAQYAKRDLRWREVRLRLLDDASEGFEGLPMPFEDSENARIERHAAEILEPGDPHAFEAAIERPREVFSGFVDCQRCPRIGSGDRAQREREISHRTPEAAGGVQRRPPERRTRIRNAAYGRPKTDNVAERGRITKRTAGVRAAGDRHEPARQRDRRAA